MLRRPKSIIEGLARWITRETDGAHGWHFDDQQLIPSAVLSSVAMWQAFEKHGTLPLAGGWLNQPLGLLVLFEVLSLMRATLEYHTSKDADWSKESRLQMDLIRWIDG